MRYAYFDADGFLLWMAAVDDPAMLQGGTRTRPVPDGTDPNALFLDGDSVVERRQVVPAVDRSMILADGSDQATLSGLPDPCWVTIDGVRNRVRGGSLTIVRSAPAFVTIALTGGHASEPIGIQAQSPREAAAAVRALRDQRLAASDWRVLSDSALDSVASDAWKAYRQALRDLPGQQAGATTDTVRWPVPPA